MQYQSLKIIAGRTQAKSCEGRVKAGEGRHTRAPLLMTVGSSLETSQLDAASHTRMWNSGCCCGVCLLTEQQKLLSLAKSGSVLTPRRQQHTGIDWNELEWRVEKEKKGCKESMSTSFEFPLQKCYESECLETLNKTRYWKMEKGLGNGDISWLSQFILARSNSKPFVE